MRQDKSSQHGVHIRETNIEVLILPEDVNDGDLEEDSLSWQHSFVNYERDTEFSISASQHSAMRSSNRKWIMCLKNSYVELGWTWHSDFNLKTIESSFCRWFDANENSTVMEKPKFAGTADNVIYLEWGQQKMDIVDICTSELANSRWRFFKFRNLTIFATLRGF